MNTPEQDQTEKSSSLKSLLPIRMGLVLKVIVLILILLTGTYYVFNSLTGGLTDKETVQSNVQRIVDSGKIIIGTDATFPPMELVDAHGNIVGYDIDLGNRIAEELNIETEFVNTPWDDLFDALLRRDVDIVISSVTITDERKLKYNFSNAYINAGQVIITRKDDTLIRSTADLTDKKIAVQKGTTNEQQALLYTSQDFVLTYDDFIKATTALLTGEADAIFSDLTGAKGIVDANPSLKIASDPFTSDLYGIMFRKSEDDLVAEVNQALNSLRQRGILVFLKQKWLE